MDNTDKYCFLDKQSPDKKKSLLLITTTKLQLLLSRQCPLFLTTALSFYRRFN